jgi:hypothetical protein
MKPLRRAAARLRDAGSIPVLAALLAFAVSAPLAAGEHNPPSDSSDLGRVEEPRSEPDSWTAPASDDSAVNVGNVGDDSAVSVSDDSGGSIGDDSAVSVSDDSGASSDDSARERPIVVAQKDYSEGRSAQPRSDSGSRPSYSPPSSSSGGNSGGGSHSGGSEPRVAEPRSSDDGSHQQRPRTGRDDGRGHGGGGWYGNGGYYGGYYGGYHGGYYSPYHNYFYWGPYFGWGWWGGWWPGDGYYGYYGGSNFPRYYDDRYGRYDATAGALDIDVAPGKTEVWIDGRYVGIADNFDGFPQYLWLDKGVYDLALYREGYQTIARQITVYAGTVVSIDDRMQRGESVKPQDLATKTHDRRDERIRSEDERREEIARRDRDNMEDWRDRARRRMEDRDRYDQRGDRNERSERDDDQGAQDADGIGRLHLEVLPTDSSVYLDGKFVGTGVDLERLRQGLRVEPGEHRVAVVRPGHKSEEQEFTVSPGQQVDLEIELESME